MEEEISNFLSEIWKWFSIIIEASCILCFTVPKIRTKIKTAFGKSTKSGFSTSVPQKMNARKNKPKFKRFFKGSITTQKREKFTIFAQKKGKFSIFSIKLREKLKNFCQTLYFYKRI